MNCIKRIAASNMSVARGFALRSLVAQTSRAYNTQTDLECSAARPRRSLLFVPADDKKKITKAAGLHADCIILECEDGVAMNRKVEARSNINEMLGQITFKHGECAIRVNSVDSGLAEDDLKAVLTGSTLPEVILLPKVESSDHIKWFSEKVKHILQTRTDATEKKMVFIFFTETPIGLLNLRETLEATCKADLPFNTEAAVFGSDDFLASLGGTRTEDAKELLFARQYFVTHCKAYNLQAIDMVHINFKDLESLRRHAEEGAKMGFTGKQIIHPNQIETVNSAFMPSTDKVKWAEELIKSFYEHQKSGRGAFTFHGSMIDLPLLKQAKNITRMVESVKNISSE